VVCEYNESRFGIRITKTDEVVEIDSTTFQNCDQNLTKTNHAVVTHFFIHKNRTVFNFDLKRLFAA
jgi:chemotaxis signal transduction protein